MALACSRDVCVLCYVLLHMFLLFFQVVELARKALLWQTQTNPKTNLSEKQNATTMVQKKAIQHDHAYYFDSTKTTK